MKISEVQKAFLKANYTLSEKELVDLFNKTFKTDYSIYVIQHYKKALGLKKGHKKAEIGTERQKGKYIVVKVAHPSVWMYKHRYVYEQAYGKIPKNHCIVFLDGDTTNCSLDNLYLVSEKVNMLMKSQRLVIGNKELTKTIIALAELQQKMLDLEAPEGYEKLPRKEQKKIRSKLYYYRNMEKVVDYRKKYYQANKEKRNAYAREYKRRKKGLK